MGAPDLILAQVRVLKPKRAGTQGKISDVQKPVGKLRQHQ